jgi:hypothetical protein
MGYGDPNVATQVPLAFAAAEHLCFRRECKKNAPRPRQIRSNLGGKNSGPQGINHWSQPLNGETDVPTFSVVRNGATVNSGTNEQLRLQQRFQMGVQITTHGLRVSEGGITKCICSFSESLYCV